MQRLWVRGVCAFLASLVWLSVFQPWGAFDDPDSFYHAKISAIIAERGPVHEFPWLDLTTLGREFVDPYLGYHYLLIPFEKVFGLLWGAQIAGTLFSALFLTVFFLCLSRLKAPAPWAWAILLALLPHVIFRLTWVKATPLALVCFLLGLMAVAYKKPWLGLMIGFAYVYTHAGWILLLACQGLFVLGRWVAERYAFEKRFTRHSLQDTFPFFATISGIAGGVLLHPNAKAFISFLWTQIFQVAVATPYGHVIMGNEWYPPDIGDLISMLALPIVALAVVGFGLIVSRRSVIDHEKAAMAIGWWCAAAFPFALMLKSTRFLEYALPLIILATAVLATQVDWKAFRPSVRTLFPRFATPLLLFCFLGFAVSNDVEAWQNIQAGRREFGRLDAAMSRLSAEAKPGDRVYESSWDLFPELFVADDRLRFVNGLDPTFLRETEPALSDAYFDLFQGKATSTAYHVVHDMAQASFVFVDRKSHPRFERVIRADARFQELFSDVTAAVFRVR